MFKIIELSNIKICPLYYCLSKPAIQYLDALNTLPQQQSKVPNTLPQSQSAEEAWYPAGPEFRQGQTRFRSYGNTFDAGDVLPSFVGQGPFCAIKHATTNLNKPPDIRVDDDNIVPLRTVALATAPLSGSTKNESSSRSPFPSRGNDRFFPSREIVSFSLVNELQNFTFCHLNILKNYSLTIFKMN